MKIIFATNNSHKIQEVNDIAKNSGITFELPPANFNPLETGTTFEENSYIKALEAARLTGKLALADDSGLCVEALNGEPGIHSARYANTQKERIIKLLTELKNSKNRNAKFVCCMTLVNPQGEIIKQVTGECNGEIIFEPKGEHGFGYDPVFKPQNHENTLAELGDDIKNEISHRGRALQKILHFLTTL